MKVFLRIREIIIVSTISSSILIMALMETRIEKNTLKKAKVRRKNVTRSRMKARRIKERNHEQSKTPSQKGMIDEIML